MGSAASAHLPPCVACQDVAGVSSLPHNSHAIKPRQAFTEPTHSGIKEACSDHLSPSLRHFFRHFLMRSRWIHSLYLGPRWGHPSDVNDENEWCISSRRRKNGFKRALLSSDSIATVMLPDNLCLCALVYRSRSVLSDVHSDVIRVWFVGSLSYSTPAISAAFYIVHVHSAAPHRPEQRAPRSLTAAVDGAATIQNPSAGANDRVAPVSFLPTLLPTSSARTPTPALHRAGGSLLLFSSSRWPRCRTAE